MEMASDRRAPDRFSPAATPWPAGALQSTPPGDTLMYDHNQLEVPDSFMALFIAPGRSRPSATRAFITARYELCEDLTNHLEAYACVQHHDLGISEVEVLQRCHAGLLIAGSGVNAAEAEWVVRRLAEMAGWAYAGPDVSVGPAAPHSNPLPKGARE